VEALRWMSPFRPLEVDVSVPLEVDVPVPSFFHQPLDAVFL
jgi:hypothetical protein